MAKEVELLVGEEGSQEVERHTVADIIRSPAIDVFDPHEREILVTFFRRTDLARDRISRLQRVALDLVLADVNVVRRVQVIIVGRTQETIPVRHYLENTSRLNSALELTRGSLGFLVVLIILIILVVLVVLILLIRLVRLVLLVLPALLSLELVLLPLEIVMIGLGGGIVFQIVE